MAKKRKFREADYAATEKTQITLGDALPADHPARFIVSVIGLLDLSEIYGQYGKRGGMPYAPEVLLGLLLYGYATCIFSSRKLERATYESIPFHYTAGNMHPDHDTINHFRKANLETLKGVFVQVLILAHVLGHVKLGNISIDGSKVHADASKSKAVSYGHILLMEKRLLQEIDALFALAEKADRERPDDLDIDDEIGRRTKKLTDLAEAKAMIEEMAAQRHAQERADPDELGTLNAAAMDAGYFSPETIRGLKAMGIEPYIAVGRDSHAIDLSTLLEGEPEPPPENASPKVKMLYKLKTETGKAIYRLRKSTVEPVFGIIKEVMGFRRFSLRGLVVAAGEWNLVCLAYNLKRLHRLHTA